MYEAIREAAEFGGPVGQGVAEMNDIRGFVRPTCSRHFVTADADDADGLRVADPESQPARPREDHSSLTSQGPLMAAEARKSRRRLYRLSPGAIKAQKLFCLDPDRDERAPQSL